MKLTDIGFRQVLSKAEQLRLSDHPVPKFTNYLKHKFGGLTPSEIQTIWRMTTCASTLRLERATPNRTRMHWMMKRNFRPKNCALCSAPLGKDFHIDHLIPVKLGGFSSGINLQPLCSSCNLKKGKKLLEVKQYAKIWNILRN